MCRYAHLIVRACIRALASMHILVGNFQRVCGCDWSIENMLYGFYVCIFCIVFEFESLRGCVHILDVCGCIICGRVCMRLAL
jgi:hypothetical protein